MPPSPEIIAYCWPNGGSGVATASHYPYQTLLAQSTNTVMGQLYDFSGQQAIISAYCQTTVATALSIQTHQALNMLLPGTLIQYHDQATTNTQLNWWISVREAMETDAAWRPPMPPRPLARPAIHNGRRALRRSIDLFRKIRPPAELDTFLRGEWLKVHGRFYDYRMRRKRDLTLVGHTIAPNGPHIPYTLEILDKETGRFLASGCVVYRDTPIVDQLLATLMHIGDRDGEYQLIRTTNWTHNLPPPFEPYRLAA